MSAPCPDADRLHTKDPTEPRGYVAWHTWAAWMVTRSRQRQCPTCGLWKIWAPTGQQLGYGRKRPRRAAALGVPVEEGT